jgi:hypothetical protein
MMASRVFQTWPCQTWPCQLPAVNVVASPKIPSLPAHWYAATSVKQMAPSKTSAVTMGGRMISQPGNYAGRRCGLQCHRRSRELEPFRGHSVGAALTKKICRKPRTTRFYIRYFGRSRSCLTGANGDHQRQQSWGVSVASPRNQMRRMSAPSLVPALLLSRTTRRNVGAHAN